MIHVFVEKKMKKAIAILAGAVFFLTAFSSCKVTQQTQYFKTLSKDTTLTGFVSNDFESKIRKGDRLAISVSSLSVVEDALFNGGGAVASAGAGSSSAGGFTVMQDGTVELHRLGKVAVEGLTRKQLAKKIQTDLLPYLKEPIVSVNYLNHKVTILGEVAKPQVLDMPEEQISVIDAIVLSGDVTANARRNNILIIRSNGTEKKVKHINLEDNSIFSSPWYYVQPDDIVMVSPDNERYVKEENRRKLQTTLSLVASGVSLLIIILDRVIK
jgi:polysaccharide export outer membrane protein